MTDAFAALADENRRRILAGLAEDGSELNVGALVERLGLSQPTISKHLKVLRDVGLVTVREDGQRRFYRVDPAGLQPIVEWLRQFPGTVSEADDSPAPEYKVAAANSDRLGFPPPNPSRLARQLGHLVGLCTRSVRTVERRSRRRVQQLIRRFRRD